MPGKIASASPIFLSLKSLASLTWQKLVPTNWWPSGNDGHGTKVWPITVRRVKVSQTHAPLQGCVLDQQGKPIAGAKVEHSPNRYVLDSWLEDTELDEWKAAPRLVGNPRLAYRSIRKANGYPTIQTHAQGRFCFENVKLGEYVLTVEADGYAPQHRHIKVEPQTQPHEFRLEAGRFPVLA